MLNKIIHYFLHNRLVTVLLLLFFIGWGLVTSPFDWDTGFLPKDPVPVDAIPDIGENQQIVFTNWPGRSPQDVEDQITYPLTTSLLGVPGVKSIRSNSMFGFSSIYIIFDEDVEFYWSRSRILEKLNSLPANLLPGGVQPTLGPDATGLGQVFWYTLEGRDSLGNVTGGWDLHELRTVQDFYVKYGLNAVEGVSEVASVGGYVQEYQVDVNPDALKAYDIGIDKVMMAVKNSNRDIGAKTIEINKVEYLVRGLGYIRSVEDLEETVVAVNNNKPVLIKDIGVVTLGPATRRGMLDKEGAEVVGGVVVARYGSNPLKVIGNVKDKIKEIASGLPKKTLEDGTESQLTIVPFYDRTQLIQETIGTLERALSHEILISIIVVIVLVLNLRASVLISSLLPVAVLMTFVVMRYAGVDANVVALSGIAIAIGVMVDVGIVFVENMIRHLELEENKNVRGNALLGVVYKATIEVAPAITTALATTVVSFLPVFFMEQAEGKLFRPLAFTKTFALAASFVLGVIVLPTLAYFVFSLTFKKDKMTKAWNISLVVAGLLLAIVFKLWLPLALVVIGAIKLVEHKNPGFLGKYSSQIVFFIILAVTLFFLAEEWVPLGHENSLVTNYLFVIVLLALILAVLLSVVYYYEPILKWCLVNKRKFLLVPLFTVFFGLVIWLGFPRTFGFVARGFDAIGWNIRTTAVWSGLSHTFPGTGKEFMPSLDEGSFLLMPTSMPHAGMEENKRVVQQLDMGVAGIPEVDMAVGKLGRVESALDPAPISMYENIINYKSEYSINAKGEQETYKTDRDGKFVLRSGDTLTNDEVLNRGFTEKDLVKDKDGEYFRNWRSHIRSSDDIWNEIVKVTGIPGVTSAPKLQPIETRLVMLQTGMRAPMGIKVYGPDLETIQNFGIQLEEVLKEVPSVKKEAVFADRIVGKPYMQLDINRNAIARYGLSVEDVQQVIESTVGGIQITSTVEGRERFPVRVRYPRELRDTPEKIRKILIPTPTGAQIPLGELADIEYVRGPQMIKSEETFLTGYVLFDKRENYAEVDVVNDAQRFIEDKIASGALSIPKGVSYKFSGNYENQVRAVKRLSIVIPLSLIVIFLLLYFQFRTVIASTIHFSGVFVAFAGGFIMLWLYGQDWFMDFAIAGVNMRDLFQMHTINLSVAVWVGFIALFGIATDDGVIMGTYIHQVFEEKQPKTVPEVRAAVLEAGLKRVRPAMMTTAVTIIALLPVLTSTGKGADIMVPMAIPTVGGMFIQIMTMFVVPVLQAYWRETVVKKTEIGQ
ncbi:efflux RND transporter permease subunit [Sinomicrobium weinanense]|uniref:Efflux RND transporter permease subunit n=1 Tax=Sinomicrobium weinanense TaxID=2842200 RepID=A0A926JRG6_9FLAO|nr:efflux RND transporter permease subunit [Sinomicrobium weinanense]MBC9795927.1 efflux RND transporter permease subunit [Sinomicrobium weinanense]MBU3124694.1 efflux RND transporter permease subunit [Sinomicrobium weinanense]